MSAGRYADLSPQEYTALSGVELGRGVAQGTWSPVQLAELALGIAAQCEPAVNAYAALRPEQALREAADREAEAVAGHVRGPLHGVPIASKDNLPLAGDPTGKGSLTTPDEPAVTSAPMVARLLAAGAVVIGRTTTPEFGWKGTGISPRTGVTRNPWDPTRNSGGSSAGSGVTVAAGAVPIATGTDAGGSVRIPAAFCGVVGLKPTLGAIPVWPGTVNESLSHAGPLTRRVADARLVLHVSAGPDARDPQSLATHLREAPTGRPLRVAVVTEPFGIAPHADVAAAFAESVGLLREAGVADLVEIDLGLDLPRDVFEALWVTGRGIGFADLIRAHGDVMDPGLVRLAALAAEYSLPDFLDALGRRRAFNAAAAAVFDSWDVLLMPTMPLTAFAAEDEVPVGGEEQAPLPWITWTPYTYPFNVTGQPAISIPTHLRAGRLPMAVQLVGPWGGDWTVLDLAERCEQVLAATIQQRTAPVPSRV